VRLDLRPLLAGDKALSFDYEFSLDIDSANSISTLYGASFPSPMKVKGDVTNNAGYMRLVLFGEVEYSTTCARCLAPINGVFKLNLEKTVATKELIGDLNKGTPDDYVMIEDGFLDLDELILDEAMLDFPMRFLCREDCKGLCQRCGRNLNDEACDCGKNEIDPRLEPLRKILEQMKQEENN